MLKLPIAGSNDEYRVNPSKIIALGLNYNDHIKESVSVLTGGFKPEKPSEPVIFPKASSAIVGLGENIVIPSFIKNYDFDAPLRTDYEAELAFFIKKDCRNVSEANAMEYVAGFTCLNDVSQRNIQNGDRSGWFRGKSFDTFCPIGPAL
jgi:2-keto-4-pentenoate hydratase/2-oxohepta-3-ene-1,7-dioic acid hydratase in catechol pathway